MHERVTLQASDGHEIHVQVWTPAESARGVIQILHGLGEYGDRYARFAAAATAQGFAVGVHDHRGHGTYSEHSGFFAAQDGWALLVTDALLVHEHLAQKFQGIPAILLGHSMGSYLAQNFAMNYGERLDALLLSSSTWAPRVRTMAGHLLARFECWRLGAHCNSALLDKLGFGNFNKRFAPARTELDWISRDSDEVDAYVADPLCGGPYTAGLWRDLTGGLLEIASDASLTRVPTSLPILISGGEEDPVGGERGMGKLAMHFAQTGHARLHVIVYPGGRHEMLNDINRDQVAADWLDWIRATTKHSHKKSPAQM